MSGNVLSCLVARKSDAKIRWGESPSSEASPAESEMAALHWCMAGLRNGTKCCHKSCAVCTGPSCEGICCGFFIKAQGMCNRSTDVSCTIPSSATENSMQSRQAAKESDTEMRRPESPLSQARPSDSELTALHWCMAGLRNGTKCCHKSCAICTGPSCEGICCGFYIKAQGICNRSTDVSCTIPPSAMGDLARGASG
eukprot:gnl/TRDRNA2_/TRDRNA2_75723_c0_seq1.p1 gnl/TRDRNA2_/TRDRNA2_75723_c0~~gnl/TRDRNA2_/TRDRNA2_75723_c0_seq1.p1  ORF type:complete len:208 (+),score=21.15 gnl/TRDRNA2_/TRDRNA2_75723_c0_seq1:34-624(+)